MEEKRREQQSDQVHDHPGQRNTGTEHQQRRVNKISDDLDEKSSTLGRTDRGRTSGLSTKDGVTGSDYDGQVTR